MTSTSCSFSKAEYQSFTVPSNLVSHDRFFFGNHIRWNHFSEMRETGW